ncbi:MAG: hypothetical protein GWN01_09245 [Nitrosopumilaceae archaeon]|nr:hypothetical protein [Nitrosopumilaceae archaeon]NIU87794.1 hypothetical protein [Nitrosopumilaceae archaeon]NIV65177.1 hypothetical protein [Nitrosopumilaceae archaeon]NIX61692.1 hypothetical protein [Nitrosopumilaceae archaeon]
MNQQLKSIRVKNIQGYNSGEIIEVPQGRALTYCRNGQAEPVGWFLSDFVSETIQPMNRMIDTRSGNSIYSYPPASMEAESLDQNDE